MGWATLVTRAASYLVTVTDWNNIINNLNNFSAVSLGGEDIENFSAGAGIDIGHVVGDVKFAFRSTNIVSSNGVLKWLLLDGSYIARATTTGADYNDDDLETLFTHLWTLDTTGLLDYRTNIGSASSRGASAAADWSAGKRLSLPDMRGRVPLVDDALGGSSANVTTDAEADTIFGTSGDDTHTLTGNQLAQHDHTGLGKHGAITNGSGQVYTVTQFSGTTGTYTTGAAGFNLAHNNLQPFMTMAALIYTGV